MKVFKAPVSEFWGYPKSRISAVRPKRKTMSMCGTNTAAFKSMPVSTAVGKL